MPLRFLRILRSVSVFAGLLVPLPATAGYRTLLDENRCVRVWTDTPGVESVCCRIVLGRIEASETPNMPGIVRSLKHSTTKTGTTKRLFSRRQTVDGTIPVLTIPIWTMTKTHFPTHGKHG